MHVHVRADSEKRLIKKCRELNAEIVANAAKVQTALKLNEEDQSTIAALKKEIEKAWKMVDASHEKEAKAKETIQQLNVRASVRAVLRLAWAVAWCACAKHAGLLGLSMLSAVTLPDHSSKSLTFLHVTCRLFRWRLPT